jgi:hypothetical protein
MFTTVESSNKFDSSSNKITRENRYETNIATNFTQIFPVSDSDTRDEALVEYEAKKSLITAKESRIDTRMQNLQTEMSAISQMIQGLESVRNENIERTFNIFS